MMTKSVSFDGIFLFFRQRNLRKCAAQLLTTNLPRHQHPHRDERTQHLLNMDAKTAGAALVAAGATALAVYAYRKLSSPGPVIETARHGGDLVADVLKAHGT